MLSHTTIKITTRLENAALTGNQTPIIQLLHQGGYRLVTLPRIVTPHRDSVDGTRDHITYQSWLRSNFTGLLGRLSVFGRCIKGMVWLRPAQMWTCNVRRHHHRSSLFFFKV